jgi:hypothetical protein
VWPDLTEADALITIDLPSGIRLCTLCVSHKQLLPHRAQAAGNASVIYQVLANVLSAARSLAEQYETEVSKRVARERRTQAGQEGGAPDRPALRPPAHGT